MAYSDRDDVEMIFGATNVAKWADLDNDEDDGKIDARVEWACEEATDRIDGRLRGGPYEVPFDGSSVPRTIVTLSARLAGVLLYDGRGVTDEEAEDRVTPHRKLVETGIAEILAGKVRLDLPQVSASYPRAVSME